MQEAIRLLPDLEGLSLGVREALRLGDLDGVLRAYRTYLGLEAFPPVETTYLPAFFRYLALHGEDVLNPSPAVLFGFSKALREAPASLGLRLPASQSTTARAVRAVVRFYRFLEGVGGVELPVIIRPYTPVTRRVLALSEEDYGAMKQAALAYPNSEEAPLAYALLLSMGEVGLTQKEVCALEVGDLDPEGGTVRVRGRPHRTAPYLPELREALEAYLAHRPRVPFPHLFVIKGRQGTHRPLYPGYALRVLKRLADLAGVEPATRISLTLRWRAIRNLYARGYPRTEVARILGLKNLP